MEKFDFRDVDFFRGERDLGYIEELIPENGKTTCSHKLIWEWIFGRSVDCGAKVSYKVTKTSGITVEQRRDLEAMVAGTLGVQFLSNLELRLKGKISQAITLQNVSSEEDTFEIQGKDCYETTVDVYQLQSILKLECEWRSFLGSKKYWAREVPVRHNKLKQMSKVEPRHEDCGCRVDTGEIIDELDIKTEKFDLREPYIIHNKQLIFFNVGMAIDDGEVMTYDPLTEDYPWPPRDGKPRDEAIYQDEMAERLLEPLLKEDLQLPYRIFPAYLRFFAGAAEDDMVAVKFGKPTDALALSAS